MLLVDDPSESKPPLTVQRHHKAMRWFKRDFIRHRSSGNMIVAGPFRIRMGPPPPRCPRLQRALWAVAMSSARA